MDKQMSLSPTVSRIQGLCGCIGYTAIASFAIRPFVREKQRKRFSH
jgi:hypothetical protein